jgi:hypothetical protein
MKRIPQKSRADVLKKLTDKITNAMALADKFYEHVHDLYDHEAMYWEQCSCFVKFKNPSVSFDWTSEDDMHSSSKSLGSIRSDVSYEKLVEYFVTVPTVDLVIDHWSNDCFSARGGRIGASTGWKWVEAEPGSSEDDGESE